MLKLGANQPMYLLTEEELNELQRSQQELQEARKEVQLQKVAKETVTRELEELRNNLKTPQSNSSLNSVEEDLNKVDGPKQPTPPRFEHDGKPYQGVAQSKIKMAGVIDKIASHPFFAPAFAALDKAKLEEVKKVSLPVVVYECLYNNPEGQIWVRMKDDFDKNFTKLNG